VNDEELTKLLTNYRQAKANKEFAEFKLEKAQQELTAYMAEHGIKSTVGTSDGNQYRITMASSERVTFNEDGLKKSLGADLWKTIVKSKIDSTLLSKAIRSGTVDPTVVAQFSTIKKSNPYIRLSAAESIQQPDSSEA
jgi:hypothetical protein